MSHQPISEKDFNQLWSNVSEILNDVTGYLTATEARFLTMASSIPSCDGHILEIGSFTGKSTIAIAKGAQKAGGSHTRLQAVDPFILPARDGRSAEETSSYPEFCDNLKKAGIADKVDVFKGFSYELAPSWENKLRFLWIDGDHTYKGAKTDFDLFSPFLEDGAIIAFHDTLNSHDGPCRVFANDVLISPHFGACGFCGSIAWAQYNKEPVTDVKINAEKKQLYKKVSKLVALTCLGQKVEDFTKMQYRLYRLLIPHGNIGYQNWIKVITK